MTIVNVKGKWDVESLVGNTVNLVGGGTIEVNDKTRALVEEALKDKPVRRTRKRRVPKE